MEPDEIHPDVLTEVENSIVRTFILFEKLLMIGDFLNGWKRTNITPSFKTKDPQSSESDPTASP